MTDSMQTVNELVKEGRRLMESGDKPGALAHLTTATRLQPMDENIWLMRAEASEDSAEVVECLNHVLEINPGNARARTWLLDSNLDQLQNGAIQRTNGARRSVWSRVKWPTLRRRLIGLGVSALCVAVLAGIVFVALDAYARSVSNQAFASAEANAMPALSLILPPTWTPSPTRTPSPIPTATPSPVWKATQTMAVRLGPGTLFAALGTLVPGTLLDVAGRTADGKYLAIRYPDSTRLGWVLAEQAQVTNGSLDSVSVIALVPTPTATAKPNTRSVVVRPAATPVPPFDFVLGRPVEQSADCGKPWLVAGTTYASAVTAQRLNGILVRLAIGGQNQGIQATGSLDPNKTGYWEWRLSGGSDIYGTVTIVSQDGSPRSEAIPFHLTRTCSGSGSANIAIIDMVARN